MEQLTIEQLEKMGNFDKGIDEAYERFLCLSAQLNELVESRDIASDAVDDTLSFDRVIQKIKELKNDTAARLNWAAFKTGVQVKFRYHTL